MKLSVSALDVTTEANWRFGDSAMNWRHRVNGAWHGSMVSFDPFPAYPHSLYQARSTALEVEQTCLPLWDVECFLANREEISRTNGHSNIHETGHYDDEGTWVKDAPVGLILLGGKRIPPHPAMTRYLIAHEYGHHVRWFLAHARGEKNLWNDDVYREYATVRGLPQTHVHAGEGGTWHDAMQEIFACDFRILVAGIEPEFWPHEGIAYPSEIRDLRAWWDFAIAQVDTKRWEMMA